MHPTHVIISQIQKLQSDPLQIGHLERGYVLQIVVGQSKAIYLADNRIAAGQFIVQCGAEQLECGRIIQIDFDGGKLGSAHECIQIQYIRDALEGMERIETIGHRLLEHLGRINVAQFELGNVHFDRQMHRLLVLEFEA